MCIASTDSFYTPYVPIIIGAILGGVSSFCVGVKLSNRNHANTLDIIKRQKISSAYDKFRGVFIETIAQLEDSIDEEPGFTFDVLRKNYIVQFTVYIDLIYALPEPDRLTLTEKWKHYCEVQDDLGVMISKEKKFYRFSKYLARTTEEEKTCRLLAIKDINSLIDSH